MSTLFLSDYGCNTLNNRLLLLAPALLAVTLSLT